MGSLVKKVRCCSRALITGYDIVSEVLGIGMIRFEVEFEDLVFFVCML